VCVPRGGDGTNAGDNFSAHLSFTEVSYAITHVTMNDKCQKALCLRQIDLSNANG